MKKISAITTLALAVMLSACATKRPIPQNVSNAAEIGALKKIEIFYNHQDYAVIVRPAQGLLALASIGEADRIVKRSEAFTAAMNTSFPGQDLNLQFAQALADKIRENGVEVKITNLSRPVGDPDIRKTKQYINAPKTPGYAPLVVRATTRYIAPSFGQGFLSSVDVSYLLVSPQGDRDLISTTEVSIGTGESYMSFDGLLEAHPAAHEQLRSDLQSLMPKVHSGIFR